MKKKQQQLGILYPVRLSFKNKGKIFSQKSKSKELNYQHICPSRYDKEFLREKENDRGQEFRHV